MAVVGSVEVEVRANTQSFERQLQSQVTKASSKAKASVELDTGKSSGLLSRFTGLVDQADAHLAKFGLTTRDVSVVLGAGLAGGIAFAGKALIDFGTQSVQAAAKLEDAQNLSRRVFEDSSVAVEEFAEHASDSLGLSERAALAAAGQFGLFAKNVGLPTEAAANLSTSLTKLASDIASSQPDFVNIEEVLIALRAALKNEFDPLERFGVTLTQASVKAKAAELGIAGLKDELTPTQKVIAAYGDILDQTNLIQGDFAATSDSLPNTMNTFSASVEDLQAALGEGLLPSVVEVVQTFNALIDGVTGAKNAISTGFGVLPEGFAKFNSRFGKGLATLGLSEVARLVRGLGDAAKGSEGPTEDLTSAQDLAAQSADALASAEDKSTDALEKVADARKRLSRALGDQVRNVDRAEDRLARAIEDSEERVDDAERGLAEAFEDRADRIADAERSLEKTRIEGARNVRDARERLADFDRDNADREIDAERNLIGLRKQRTKAILDANVALSAAKRAGDAEAINAARLALKQSQDASAINEAERDLAQERKDRKLERERLERELNETIIDTKAQEADAQRDLAQTIEDTNERIEDSERSLADARRDGARQVEDAQRGLNDAIRESKERVEDAKEALSEYEEKAILAAKATKRLKNEMKDLDKIAVQLAEDFFDPAVNDAFKELMGLQHGGPAIAGRPYLVGEAGPELMVPGRSGSVVSNDQLVAVLEKMVASNGGSQGPGIGQVLVQVPHQDARVLANELSYRLLRGVVR